MEDVLEVYARPYDASRPVVCVDEGRKELRSTVRAGIPARPGQPAREDYEYEREGVRNLFVALEPLVGRRKIQVTERRTACDFARFLRLISDEMYPEAHKIVLVVDNLNTHHVGCLYEAFAPAEAFRLSQRFEWHFTPEHGSWLNMAEIELSVLQRQCLSRRLSASALDREISAWESGRNALSGQIHWQFTAADARVRLRRLYPKLPDEKC